ncbi:MAG: TIGR02450 family Trp-rich protein [Microcoleus sp. SIO2G3]|nr:TIGR02450 family Trp-rich protein [Microcoleus sp. SIO2G3]
MPKKQKFPHLVGSKWTAQQETWGWRHFQVVNRKNEGQWVFAEMIAACDPTVRFWLNARQLKDRKLWRSGWQTLQEMGIEPKGKKIPDDTNVIGEDIV